jgi:hypothetical protein
LSIRGVEKKSSFKKDIIRIIVEFDNGIIYRTPILIDKALDVIEQLPTSMEYANNYLFFENDKKQHLKFRRVFNNQWDMELSEYQEHKAPRSLWFKLFSTNVVKIAVINFYRGEFLGAGILGLNKELSIKRLKEIVNEIKARMKNQLFCKYCRNKITRIKLKCDYCNTNFDFSIFSFKSIQRETHSKEVPNSYLILSIKRHLDISWGI